jgi:FKBP-type peptidyl-prolyl cis-trans isomerase
MRFVIVALALCAACQKADDGKKDKAEPTAKPADIPGSAGGAKTRPPLPQSQQVAPPFDIQNPPADVVKQPSGLMYKKLVTNPDAPAPKRNDIVMINFTGWKQSTGETFFTNKARGQPMPLNLAATAPGFIEAFQLLHKGEKAVLWLPPSIGYKGPPQGNPETLVYQVEVVDIISAPAIPTDLKEAPATAEKTAKSSIPFVVVKQGTGKDKAKSYDNVTYLFSVWDSDGRMYDSTEMKKRPTIAPPYRQPAPLEEILTNMTAGERVRFWIAADKMSAGHPAPNMPTGLVVYEIEVVQIEPGTPPPETPPDVKEPPKDAKKTEKGVSYKVLKAGPGGPHPKPTDSVKVHYSGWTTDGKMFDSSVTRGAPAEFSLQGVIMGWTDGIPVMSVGDKVRFWIPEELAYKGAPGKPQGMLVFDVELLEIKAPAKPDGMPPHAPHMPPHAPPPQAPPPHH